MLSGILHGRTQLGHFWTCSHVGRLCASPRIHPAQTTFRARNFSVHLVKHGFCHSCGRSYEHIATPLPFGRSHRHHARRWRTAAAAEIAEHETQTQSPKSSNNVAPKSQGCDYTVLAASVAELSQTWLPAKVDQVIQADAQSLCLKLRTAGKPKQGQEAGQMLIKWLWLCWHPQAARLCTGADPARGSAAEGFSLGEQVHALLAGKVLTHAAMPCAWERVAELRFGPRISENPSHLLYLEVMGRHSNLVVTGADKQIEACGRQVGANQSRLRQLQTGSRYELPPPNPNGLEPSSSEPSDAWQRNVSGQAKDGKNIAAGLVRAYQGVSPALARELLEAAGASASAEALTDEQWQSLHHQWQRWLNALATGSFSAIADSSTGRMSVLGGSGSSATTGAHGSVHQMLDEYFRGREDFGSFGQLQQSVSGALSRALKRARGKAKGLADNLKAAEGSDATSRQAEMIMANLYRCKQGDDSVEAEDWDTGEKITIALDPKKAPVKTAEAQFAKARKQRRAVDHLGPLLQAANEELEYLSEIESQLEMLTAREADDLQALQDIQEELVQSGHAKAPADSAAAAKGAAKGRKAAKRAKGPEKGAAKNPFRKFTSPGGLTVLIGRNNRQNDELSHKVAQPKDIWMHARGVSGAHTVMRIPSGRDASDADVSFAADLAAWFSKARDEGKVEVTVCNAADVKRPKGAKPGQALVTKERVQVGRPQNSAAAKTGDEG